MTKLSEHLTLPCGATVPNRLVKAAMTEGLANVGGEPTPALEQLYRIWSEGGSGVLLTGNVVVDAYHLERPGNVVVDREPDEAMKAALASWARAATSAGNHAWVQISHAGRQTLKTVNPHPKAPSAVKLGLPGGQFGEPVALTVEEIADLVQRFAVAAKAMQEAGFTGVQIHGAHGYLISQFLSPRSNQRDDAYGGELAHRARFLLEIIDAVRAAVGPGFPVAVKLNSADFQKGGFAFEDSLQVAKWLEEHSVDVIEISGGTYEQPKLLGKEGIEPTEKQHVAETTLRREAYFVDFALAMQKQVSIPLMVTGGFRSRAAMEQALDEGGAALIGLGRPLCVQTDGPARLLAGAETLPRYEDDLALLPPWLDFLKGLSLVKTLSTFATTYWFYAQLDSLGRNGKVMENLSVLKAAMQVSKQQSSFLKARRSQT
ncbi:NADH:flavin oxidoreductase/NADH oxidase family protein [Congregibacter litoralis]|uniref:NADH:flavin oxidoreductase, Old Yellow Enzyme family n=1 Tax=Congregibacter litoralis KT71 TaxID=314285 RepID=A4A5W7_9GAMM|nr:NADH:flavin oxidoreductase/NADH oxidase family protein [Congregibacter litoralis]EAQ98414.2 NADH:flavin oxidoreductase, Old Yellow Enzyme family [Congregibacter litoralis KT71]